MTTLWLDFAGVGSSATETLSFGRNAELALDEDNRFMHRITGEFRWNGLVWWLHNVGTSTQLLVFGTNGTRIELPPGTECALPMARTPDAPGDATVEFGTALTDRETIYLTTFALSRLRGSSISLLSYADVAQMWSVSEKTVDNTLQRVRGRMKQAGVRNTETLEGLVNHLLAHGRIGLSTLHTIEETHPGVLPG